MKKVLKMLTAAGTAALAVVGGLFIYQKFFGKEEDFDEDFDDDFDDDELFEEDGAEDVTAFDDEEEIFEEEAGSSPEASAAKKDADTKEDSKETVEKTPEKEI